MKTKNVVIYGVIAFLGWSFYRNWKFNSMDSSKLVAHAWDGMIQ